MMNDTEVTAIAQGIFRSVEAQETGRVSYLRALVSTTQENLKKGQEPTTQLAALMAVHERFYALVLAAAEEFVPKGTKDRGVELHKRANFARTSLSALRGHVKAGGDIATLIATKTTKASLRVRKGPTKPPSAARLKKRTETVSKTFMATLMELSDADKAAAIEEIQLIIGQLSTQLISMGVVATKDAAEASIEHRPLKIGKMLFMPTATQVLRQQENPS